MVYDENSRIRIQDPDPLVRGMNPWIRIRIHPKMSWIRNTAKKFHSSYLLTNGNGAGERLGRGGDLDAGHHSIVPEPALARLLKVVVDQDGLTVVQIFQLHPPLLQ
jgi:hypothetical protein